MDYMGYWDDGSNFMKEVHSVESRDFRFVSLLTISRQPTDALQL